MQHRQPSQTLIKSIIVIQNLQNLKKNNKTSLEKRALKKYVMNILHHQNQLLQMIVELSTSNWVVINKCQFSLITSSTVLWQTKSLPAITKNSRYLMKWKCLSLSFFSSLNGFWMESLTTSEEPCMTYIKILELLMKSLTRQQQSLLLNFVA